MASTPPREAAYCIPACAVVEGKAMAEAESTAAAIIVGGACLFHNLFQTDPSHSYTHGYYRYDRTTIILFFGPAHTHRTPRCLTARSRGGLLYGGRVCQRERVGERRLLLLEKPMGIEQVVRHPRRSEGVD